MCLSETQEKYEAKHQWLCNGTVLKLEDSKCKNNLVLFKVNLKLVILKYDVLLFFRTFGRDAIQ